MFRTYQSNKSKKKFLNCNNIFYFIEIQLPNNKSLKKQYQSITLANNKEHFIVH